MWGNLLRVTVAVTCRAEGRIQVSISSPVFLFYHTPSSTSPPKLGNFFSIDAHSHGMINIAKMVDTDQKMKSVASHLNNCCDVIWILASSSYPVFRELGD